MNYEGMKYSCCFGIQTIAKYDPYKTIKAIEIRLKWSTKSTADYGWTTQVTGTVPLDASWTPWFRNKD